MKSTSVKSYHINKQKEMRPPFSYQKIWYNITMFYIYILQSCKDGELYGC